MVRKTNSKDRRRHPRYLVYLPITIRRPNAPMHEDGDAVYNGFCIDIGHGGIRFGSGELFQLHERIELMLYSPDGGPQLTCEAEVVRVARVPKHYEIAAKITMVLPTGEDAAAPPAAARKV